jgi:hypothetical protein
MIEIDSTFVCAYILDRHGKGRVPIYPAAILGA